MSDLFDNIKHDDKKAVCVWVREDTWERFRKLCKSKKISASKAIDMIIEDVLKRECKN